MITTTLMKPGKLYQSNKDGYAYVQHTETQKGIKGSWGTFCPVAKERVLLFLGTEKSDFHRPAYYRFLVGDEVMFVYASTGASSFPDHWFKRVGKD